MSAKTVFQLQLRKSWLSQLSAGHPGHADLSGARYVVGRPAHRI